MDNMSDAPLPACNISDEVRYQADAIDVEDGDTEIAAWLRRMADWLDTQPW
jgi:hypothetical protein